MKCRDGSVNKALSSIYFTAINTGIKFGKNSRYKWHFALLLKIDSVTVHEISQTHRPTS